jgi:hypothetical protein
MWYSADLLLESVSLTSDSSPEPLSWEERIVLINAANWEEASHKAQMIGVNCEYDYISATTEHISVRFVRCMDLFELFDKDIVEGTELYSRQLHRPPDRAESDS